MDLPRIGTIRLITYKRVGRVYSLQILSKIMEESKGAREG